MTACSSNSSRMGDQSSRIALETGFDRLFGRRGERVPGLPDGRAHEAVDDVAAHGAGGPGGGLHLVDRPLAEGLGLALDGVGGEAVEARVVLVADALAGEVGAEGPALEAVLLEDPLPVADVGEVGRGSADVHVIAPAGDLEAVIAPRARLFADFLERQVGPLAGEQRDGSCHGSLLFEFFSWPGLSHTRGPDFLGICHEGLNRRDR